MFVLEEIVVSGFPIPKANLPPSKAVPKSLATPGTSPSTKPAPLYHWPVPAVWVVLTQKDIEKSLSTRLVIVTSLALPLKLRQPLIRPELLKVTLAPISTALLPLPETSG